MSPLSTQSLTNQQLREMIDNSLTLGQEDRFNRVNQGYYVTVLVILRILITGKQSVVMPS